MSGYVLDTSAIMCLLFREPGADQVLAVLEAARRGINEDQKIYVPFIALMETEYLLLRQLSPQEADYSRALITSWAIEVVESDPEWRRQAAQVKASYPLSLADAWIASLALTEDAELVHKDPEYDRVAGLRALRLPYRGG